MATDFPDATVEVDGRAEITARAAAVPAARSDRLGRARVSIGAALAWPPTLAWPSTYAWLPTLALMLTATLAAPLAAQSDGRAPGAEWTVPRTEHGHPDLQGNWTNATLTPIERRSGHTGPVLSPAEVRELEGRRAELDEELNAPSDPDRPPPPQGGFDDGQNDPFGISGTGTYNNVYWQGGDRVAVFDGEPRSSLVVDPPDGRIPELTAEGRARVDARRAFQASFGDSDNPENRSLAERCIVSFGSNAGPPMLPNYAYNNLYTIVQTEDHVAILTEMVHDVRIIRLGEVDPLPDHVRPWFGDSRGEWRGDTLVVETTNLHPSQRLRGVPVPADMRVTERFTRAGPGTIHYEFTVEAPSTWTEPWSGQVPFNRTDDRVYEYACHEGNYAMENMLSGARYQERQAGEQREQEDADQP